MPWRRMPPAHRAGRSISGFTRACFAAWTLGVRGLVLNQAGEVLLVEHTYMPG